VAAQHLLMRIPFVEGADIADMGSHHENFNPSMSHYSPNISVRQACFYLPFILPDGNIATTKDKKVIDLRSSLFIVKQTTKQALTLQAVHASPPVISHSLRSLHLYSSRWTNPNHQTQILAV